MVFTTRKYSVYKSDNKVYKEKQSQRVEKSRERSISIQIITIALARTKCISPLLTKIEYYVCDILIFIHLIIYIEPEDCICATSVLFAKQTYLHTNC